MTTQITQEMLMAAAHQASRNGLLPGGELALWLGNNDQLRQVLEAALDAKNYLRQAKQTDRRRGIRPQSIVAA